MSRIAFRTDSSLKIGSGHVSRCRNFARRLKEKGHEVVFLCADLKGHCASLPREDGFPTIMLSRDPSYAAEGYAGWLGASEAQDAAQTVAALSPCPPAWTVVDHYALGASWHKAVRQGLGCRLFAIDDLANRAFDVDALLNQNYGKSFEAAYPALTPKDCRLFLGPSYALLAPDFYRPRPPRPAAAQAKRLLVFFGGMDASGATVKTLGALKKACLPLAQTDVVCGGKNPRLEEIRALCAAQGATLHVDTPHMADLIAAADACVGGGGTNMWERCFLGLPALVLTVAENQEKIAREAAEAGFIALAGRDAEISETALAKALTQFLCDADKLSIIAKRCVTLYSSSSSNDLLMLFESAP